MNPQIPKKFQDRYIPLVDDPEAFLSSLLSQPPKSFRVNALKSSAPEVKSRLESYGFSLKQMSWYPEAFISDNPAVGGTLEHFLGHIYMQELTSMLPPLALRAELERGKASPTSNGNLTVLDACAAPGSKTTQLAALMHNRGTIIANDLSYERIRALRFNLEKTGVLNTIITNHDLRFLPQDFPANFDAILLDAPCSSEGMIRKNPAILVRWSESDIMSRAGLQKRLLLKAWELLSPGGALVYSTCTFAPEENEGVLDFLLSNSDAKVQSMKIPGLRTSHGIPEWRGRTFSHDVKKFLRVWPHHNDTEGFFLAKVSKP